MALEEKATLSVRVPVEWINEIEEVARIQGVTKSDVLIGLLKEFLNKQPVTGAQTDLDRLTVRVEELEKKLVKSKTRPT